MKNNQKPIRHFLLVVLLGGSLLMIGCGQKGPLYIDRGPIDEQTESDKKSVQDTQVDTNKKSN